MQKYWHYVSIDSFLLFLSVEAGVNVTARWAVVGMASTHAFLQDITDLLFDCGCDMVTQVVKVDGVDEYFKMYASEREKKVSSNFDYYLSIHIL